MHKRKSWASSNTHDQSDIKILNIEFPFFPPFKWLFKSALELSLLLKMNVAGGVAGLGAN